jgi:hypothetical protein
MGRQQPGVDVCGGGVNPASTLFCGFVDVYPVQCSMREASAGCQRNASLECPT